MSNYKKIGLLPFYKSDQPQDWQLKGYYYNWLLSAQYVPRDKLVSFSTPPVSGEKTAPTQITIRKLKIKGDVKTILSSTVYNVTLYANFNGSQTYYYFIQSSITSDIDEYLEVGCIYEIYLEDADGNSFISNIFIAIEESKIYIAAEDSQAILTEAGEQILFE